MKGGQLLTHHQFSFHLFHYTKNMSSSLKSIFTLSYSIKYPFPKKSLSVCLPFWYLPSWLFEFFLCQFYVLVAQTHVSESHIYWAVLGQLNSCHPLLSCFGTAKFLSPPIELFLDSWLSMYKSPVSHVTIVWLLKNCLRTANLY